MLCSVATNNNCTDESIAMNSSSIRPWDESVVLSRFPGGEPNAGLPTATTAHFDDTNSPLFVANSSDNWTDLFATVTSTSGSVVNGGGGGGAGGFGAEVMIPLYSVIFILSVVGNILVIVTLTQNRRMRTVTNVFLLNLVSGESGSFSRVLWLSY